MDEDMQILEAKVASLAGQIVALQTLVQVIVSTHPDADRLGAAYARAVQGFLDGTFPTPIMEQARDGIEFMRDRILLAVEKKPYVLS